MKEMPCMTFEIHRNYPLSHKQDMTDLTHAKGKQNNKAEMNGIDLRGNEL